MRRRGQAIVTELNEDGFRVVARGVQGDAGRADEPPTAVADEAELTLLGLSGLSRPAEGHGRAGAEALRRRTASR